MGDKIMDNKFDIEDASGRLGELVWAAGEGTDIILTRDGVPAARLTATETEYLDGDEYEKLLRDIHLYSRAMAAFAVAEHPSGYDFARVINALWQRIRFKLDEVAAVPPGEVREPFADEARGVREVARADAEAIAARPSARWAD
uniref:Prevent-host-death family protein n=1 Tax=Salinispora arenicola (strain CNS-205) TaxID=391037 RepID=A8LZX8_SALAI